MKYGFGVDLGGTTVKIVFFTQEGELLFKWEIPTNIENNGSGILPDIAASLGSFMAEKGVAREDILGIGIGVPGAVTGDGVVHICDNLGWGVVNVQEELGGLTGFRVVAGNDATVAALGECWKGGGQGCRNMVMITLGTGVGGGMVVGGNVLMGAHGAGGEIGHMVLNRAETESCGCGKKGCVEQYCSATGIVRLMKKHLQSTPYRSVLQGREFACKDVFDAAAGGDIPAVEVLEQVYAYLGEFIANICCVIDPEVVVLGGGVSKAGAPLLEGVERHFAHYAYHACTETEFVQAALGNDAGVYGAFRLLLI